MTIVFVLTPCTPEMALQAKPSDDGKQMEKRPLPSGRTTFLGTGRPYASSQGVAAAAVESPDYNRPHLQARINRGDGKGSQDVETEELAKVLAKVPLEEAYYVTFSDGKNPTYACPSWVIKRMALFS